ncbi:DUF2000 domain-containing protein [Patescibacteria group bacterium]|nr:DUF2000 domain-containing protein [Patescibacteria group bacterium]MBU4397031.1 DUF2000 domain-containing protein [Patescibacteria group bacterium]MBU4578525.1 DUF2000 domain-containing protein [Patescibacteria group bacterium]MCG2702188.1 DUF2000 domain-containing protein [Candidatus Parcubacteria bacterium]
MQQDFSKRISIVVNKELPIWQAMNAVAHISAYFGYKLDTNFGTGEYFVTKDGINLPRNTQYPIIVFAATEAEIYGFANKARQVDVKSMFFIKEMIETSNDDEIGNLVGQENEESVTYLGAGVFGENAIVKGLTNGFKLWS